MRNCFVLGCDAYCKKMNCVQRKMFLAPKKLLSQWAAVLPNKKRQFKEHDRVCERHFDEADIVQFWESTINGQVHLTPRDKPKLRENAVPCKNLPTADEIPLKPEEEMLKKRKEKVQILSQKIFSSPAKRKLKKDEADMKPSKMKKAEKSPAVVISTPALENTKEEVTDMRKVIEAAEIEFALEVTAEHQEVFDNLYDEAFDVTLPSLLWGIHRDPDRKFIAFSEFNQKTMSNCKLLHITDTLRCSTFISNQLKSSQMLQTEEQVTCDYVSSLLEELDKEPLTSS